jgi:type I restriction enzyme M protein
VDVKALVVEDKWLSTIPASIHGEVQNIMGTLVGKVAVAEKRYFSTLPTIQGKVERLSKQVAEHLEEMGLRLQ